MAERDNRDRTQEAPGGALLDRLFETIATQRGGDPDTSYTAKLLKEGRSRAAQKLGEEALEAALAAVAGDRHAVIAESADLLYHLLVLWAALEIAPQEVWRELSRRKGISGLAEKARRPQG